jgi:hypothetical protein
VPHAVVDVLKIVEIDEVDPDASTARFSLCNQSLEMREQVPPVRQVG